jgi:hypothetical protein
MLIVKCCCKSNPKMAEIEKEARKESGETEITNTLLTDAYI